MTKYLVTFSFTTDRGAERKKAKTQTLTRVVKSASGDADDLLDSIRESYGGRHNARDFKLISSAVAPEAETKSGNDAGLKNKVTALETQVAKLQATVDALRAELAGLTAQAAAKTAGDDKPAAKTAGK